MKSYWKKEGIWKQWASGSRRGISEYHSLREVFSWPVGCVGPKFMSSFTRESSPSPAELSSSVRSLPWLAASHHYSLVVLKPSFSEAERSPRFQAEVLRIHCYALDHAESNCRNICWKKRAAPHAERKSPKWSRFSGKQLDMVLVFITVSTD